MNRPLTLALLATALTPLLVGAEPAPRRLSREALRDKIKGAWAGQMIGVAYGAKTEFRAKGVLFEAEIKPEPIKNAITQDDLYVEMTFARVLDTVGLDATSADFGAAFKDSRYQLWHANAAARRTSVAASLRRSPDIPATTRMPTTSISRSRPTSSGSCARGCRRPRTRSATAWAG
jgi:hypothetical protein